MRNTHIQQTLSFWLRLVCRSHGNISRQANNPSNPNAINHLNAPITANAQHHHLLFTHSLSNQRITVHTLAIIVHSVRILNTLFFCGWNIEQKPQLLSHWELHNRRQQLQNVFYNEASNMFAYLFNHSIETDHIQSDHISILYNIWSLLSLW